MGKNSLPAFLIGLLFLTVLFFVIFAALYIQSYRSLRSLQAEANAVGNRQRAARNLAGDVIEYSKTHPDVGPILKSVGLQPAAPEPKTK